LTGDFWAENAKKNLDDEPATVIGCCNPVVLDGRSPWRNAIVGERSNLLDG
jgi:hypothetical protein